MSGLSTITIETSVTEEVGESLEKLFTYEPWTPEQNLAGVTVKEALKKAYAAILVNVPSTPARTRALNMLTDARMLANQAITFKGDV